MSAGKNARLSGALRTQFTASKLNHQPRKPRQFGAKLFSTFVAFVLAMGLSIPTMALSVMAAYAADDAPAPTATNDLYSGPTQGLVDLGGTGNPDRVSDPATMFGWSDLNDLNSRYAGRVWTDKSVFPYLKNGEEITGPDISDVNNQPSYTLKGGNDETTFTFSHQETSETVAENHEVKFNDDFLEVFSAIGSSQATIQVNPVAMNLSLDITASLLGQNMENTLDATNTLIQNIRSYASSSQMGVGVYWGTYYQMIPLSVLNGTDSAQKHAGTPYIYPTYSQMGDGSNNEAILTYCFIPPNSSIYQPDGSTEDLLTTTYNQAIDGVETYYVYNPTTGTTYSLAGADFQNLVTNSIVSGTGSGQGHHQFGTVGNFQASNDAFNAAATAAGLTPISTGNGLGGGTDVEAGVIGGLQTIAQLDDKTVKLADGTMSTYIPISVIMTDGYTNHVLADFGDSAVTAFNADGGNNWNLSSDASVTESGGTWWYPYTDTTYPNGLSMGVYQGGAAGSASAVLNAAYWKAAIANEYYGDELNPQATSQEMNNVLIYTVGMGGNSQGHYNTLDPTYGTNYFASGQPLRTAFNQWKAGQTSAATSFSDGTGHSVSVAVNGTTLTLTGSNGAGGYPGGQSVKSISLPTNYTFNFNALPASGAWNAGSDGPNYHVTMNQLDPAYPTQAYGTTDDNDIASIYTQIYQDIISRNPPFAPVEGEDASGASNYVTYIDPIGDFMDVKDVEQIVLFDQQIPEYKTAIYDPNIVGITKPGWYFTGTSQLVNEAQPTQYPDTSVTDPQNYDWDTYSFYIPWETLYSPEGDSTTTFLPDGYINAGNAAAMSKVTFVLYRVTLPDTPDADDETIDTPQSFPDDLNEIYRDQTYYNPSYENSTDANSVSFKISDLRIWTEESGGIDTDPGTVTDTDFSESMHIALPSDMLPIVLDQVRLGNDGEVQNYVTDAGDPQSSYPFRAFYTVGIDADYLNADGEVNIAKVAAYDRDTSQSAAGASGNQYELTYGQQYIADHTDADGNLRFYPNYYAGQEPDNNGSYNSWFDGNEYMAGNAASTFSPGPKNRYYIYQKNLILYKNAFVYDEGANTWQQVSANVPLPQPGDGSSTDREAVQDLIFGYSGLSATELAQNLSQNPKSPQGVTLSEFAEQALPGNTPIDNMVILCNPATTATTEDLSEAGNATYYVAPDYYRPTTSAIENEKQQFTVQTVTIGSGDTATTESAIYLTTEDVPGITPGWYSVAAEANATVYGTPEQATAPSEGAQVPGTTLAAGSTLGTLNWSGGGRYVQFAIERDGSEFSDNTTNGDGFYLCLAAPDASTTPFTTPADSATGTVPFIPKGATVGTPGYNTHAVPELDGYYLSTSVGGLRIATMLNNMTTKSDNATLTAGASYAPIASSEGITDTAGDITADYQVVAYQGNNGVEAVNATPLLVSKDVRYEGDNGDLTTNDLEFSMKLEAQGDVTDSLAGVRYMIDDQGDYHPLTQEFVRTRVASAYGWYLPTVSIQNPILVDGALQSGYVPTDLSVYVIINNYQYWPALLGTEPNVNTNIDNTSGTSAVLGWGIANTGQGSADEGLNAENPPNTGIYIQPDPNNDNQLTGFLDVYLLSNSGQQIAAGIDSPYYEMTGRQNQAPYVYSLRIFTVNDDGSYTPVIRNRENANTETAVTSTTPAIPNYHYNYGVYDEYGYLAGVTSGATPFYSATGTPFTGGATTFDFTLGDGEAMGFYGLGDNSQYIVSETISPTQAANGVKFDSVTNEADKSIAGTSSTGQMGATYPTATQTLTGTIDAPNEVNFVNTSPQIPAKSEVTPGEGAQVGVGDPVSYQIAWSAPDTAGTHTVTITDQLDAGLTFAAAGFVGGGDNDQLTMTDGVLNYPNGQTFAPGTTGATITITYSLTTRTVIWTLKNVPAGATGTVTLDTVVNRNAYTGYVEENGEYVPNDELDLEVVNQGTITYDDNPTITTNTVLNPLEQKEEVTPGDGAYVGIGDQITYNIYYKNDTGAPATVRILDPLDPGVDFVSASFMPALSGLALDASAITNGSASASGGGYSITYDENASLTNFDFDVNQTSNNGAVTWMLPPQPDGAIGYVTLVVAVNDLADQAGLVDNQAHVQVANSGAYTNIPENPLENKIETTPGDGEVIGVGESITYEIEWRNESNGPAAVTIQDPLDPNVEFVAATFVGDTGSGLTAGATTYMSSAGNTITYAASGAVNGPNGEPMANGAQNNGVVTWTLPGQSAGATGKVTLTVRVSAFATPNVIVDNQALITVGNASTLTSIPENPLEEKIEMTPGDGEYVKVGDTLTYRVYWANHTDAPAPVTVVDPLDPGVDFVDASFSTIDGLALTQEQIHGGKGIVSARGYTIAYDQNATASNGFEVNGAQANNGVVTWTLPAQPAGATGYVLLVVAVNANATTEGHVDNQAYIQVGNEGHFSNIPDNPLTGQHKAEISPGAGENVVVGETITYRINYQNDSPQVATITIVDPIDVGLTYMMSNPQAYYDANATLPAGTSVDYDYHGVVTWVIPGVQPGAYGSVTLTCQVNANALNAFMVHDQAFVQVGNGAFQPTEEPENPLGKPEKVETAPGDEQTVSVGDEITYQITYSNPGNTPATVTIVDPLDAGVEFVSATAGGSYNAEGTLPEGCTAPYDWNGVVTWTIPDVAAFGGGSVTLTVRVTERALDDLLVQNQSFAQVGNGPWIASAIPENPLNPGGPHKVEITPGDGVKVYTGEKITYAISYENYTDAPATITIVDPLDPGVTFVSATNGGVYDPNVTSLAGEFAGLENADRCNGCVTWVINNVPARSAGYVTLVVQVSNNVPDYMISNQAAVKVNDAPAVYTEIPKNPDPSPTTTTSTLPQTGDGFGGGLVALIIVAGLAAGAIAGSAAMRRRRGRQG